MAQTYKSKFDALPELRFADVKVGDVLIADDRYDNSEHGPKKGAALTVESQDEFGLHEGSSFFVRFGPHTTATLFLGDVVNSDGILAGLKLKPAA